MANIEPPGWNKALRLEDWHALNRYIVKECRRAPGALIKAWGRGGSQGTRAVQDWDGSFENLYCRIYDLSIQGKLFPEAEDEVLIACEQIMAVKRVPHWDHVELIAALRTILKPDKAWNDYPEDAEIEPDVSQLPEEDDDEEPM